MKKKSITLLVAAMMAATPIVPMMTVESAYAATTKLAPPATVTLMPDRSVTWASVANNAGYTINIYDAVTNKKLDTRTASTNTTSLKLDNLLTNGSYFVRIITKAASYSTTYRDSAESSKSNTLEIAYKITLSEPDKPELSSDGLVKWKIGGNSGYQINVYHSPSNTLVTSQTVEKDTTQFDILPLLPADGTYYVKVIAKGDGNGMSDSQESEGSDAQPLAKAANLTAPSSPTLSYEQIAKWNPVEGNNGYRVTVYGENDEVAGFAQAPRDATSLDVSHLIKKTGDYYIKISALGDRNNSSPDSVKSSAQHYIIEPHLLAVARELITTAPSTDPEQPGASVTLDTEKLLAQLNKKTDVYNLLLPSQYNGNTHLYIDGKVLDLLASRSDDAELRFHAEEGSLLVPIAKLIELASNYSFDLADYTLEIGIDQQPNLITYVPVEVPETEEPTESTDPSESTDPVDDADMTDDTDTGETDTTTDPGTDDSDDLVFDFSNDTDPTGWHLTGIGAGLDLGTTMNATTTMEKKITPYKGLANTPVKFTLNLVNRSKEAVVNLTDATEYLSYLVPLSFKSSDIHSLAGVRIQEDGKYNPVPTYFEEGDNGKLNAIFRYQGTGMFAIMKKQLRFPDVADTYFAKQSIESLSTRSVINGFEDGTFRPNETVTRAEFATMLVRALGLKDNTEEGAPAIFSDVTDTEWFYNVVNTAFEAKLISGTGEGKFSPYDLITEQEISAMIARALKYAGYEGTLTSQEQAQLLGQLSNSSAISEWARPSVALTFKAGVLTGTTLKQFTPLRTADRGTAADMLYRMMKSLQFAN